MSRISSAFKIREGEERTSALLTGLMLVTAGGSALGSNATEALFFARFGVELLPYMYIVLGILTFATSMAISGLIGRIPKQRLFFSLPLIIAFILVIERLIILLNLKWFFAVMWLGMNIIGSLQGLLTWGLASTACDTRQAKRLFPLFTAGGILGTMLGGLATRPLAGWLHSENLLLIWAGALFISFGISRLLTRELTPAKAVPVSHRHPGIIAEMQRGYKFVRQSPIMQWVSFSAVLFSVCFFSLALPFSRGATAQFPDADRLAGFLGLFQSLSTGVALLLSLFLTNRLFARFGILPMLLLFPVIYLIGFGVLAFAAPFAILVTVRFIKMAWMEGVAGTAWQALFNVVPTEQRDQVRAFISGVPGQTGTLIAGLILVAGEQALQPQQLYLIGLAAAALLVYIIWRADRAYSSALVEALRAGQPHMFFSEEQPFGGFHRDAEAVTAVINGLSDPEAATRRVSAEILGNLPVPEAASALTKALQDDDMLVRVAALKGLSRSGATSALLEITVCLSDPEAEVRYQAINSMRQLTPFPRGISTYVEPLLVDPDPLVRAQAALALLSAGDHPGVRNILRDMVADADAQVRAHALNALGETGDRSAFELARSALEDRVSHVRKAASRAMVGIDPSAAIQPLIQHLNDDDTSVRLSLAEALGMIGTPALDPLLRMLEIPEYEDGILLALEHIPVQKAAPQIRFYANKAAEVALHYHRLASRLSQVAGGDNSRDGRTQLLVESLQDTAHHKGLNALRALGLLKSREALSVAIENLRSRDGAQRANALETLESTGEREIIRPLLALWETRTSPPDPLSDDWLQELLRDPHAWLRACAALVASGSDDPDICNALHTLAQSDPDPIVRSVSQKAISGDYTMDTLATLSLMERILFLRRVPIFADLAPADLKQVASIAGEAVFGDGELLAQQGETGDEMYIVVSGKVQVLMTLENQTERRQVAWRLPGDYVGEMAIISREPRIATLVAAGSVRTLYLNQKQFEGILRERPEISLAVMRVLCQRLKAASEESVNVMKSGQNLTQERSAETP